MKIRVRKHSALSDSIRSRRLRLRLSLGAAGFVGALGFTLPNAAFAKVLDNNRTIRVRVSNYTQASDGVMAGAEREASRIFGEAGIALVWLSCPPAKPTAVRPDPCREALEATDIVLRVLSEPNHREFEETVFGFVVHPLLANVYYDRVLVRAKRDDAEFEVRLILGCIMAHEIGHLLLGSNAHSASGVMQRRWEPKQIRQAVTGVLLFTPEQVRLIQAAAETRTKLPAPASRSGR